MKRGTRRSFAAISVLLFLVVGGVAVALGPSEARLLLLACSLLSVAMAVQAVSASPGDLALALLFGVVPVMALPAADASPLLVVGLGVALLAASELNALAWRTGGATQDPALVRQWVVDVVRLAALGVFGAGVALAAASIPLPAPTLAVALAALALAGTGAALFGGSSEGR